MRGEEEKFVGEEDEKILRRDWPMRGEGKNCLTLIATVDTGATSTKQCEAITNVAIRVMRLKRDG